MWKRNTLKKKARTLLKQNYWNMSSVCFLLVALACAYPLSTAFLGAQTPGHSSEGNPGTPFALFSILRTVNYILTEKWSPSLLFLCLGIVTAFLYHFFVNNIILIGTKRYFLEVKNYPKTKVAKVFFLYKLRCVLNPAWIMMCRSVFQFLWCFTIAGGVIKHYEYSMIPFILAENPKISRKDAFALSKQLMKNNKMKLFLLRFSFLGWRLLSLVTFGLADIFLVNPYMACTEAELYLTLRRNYVLSRSPKYEYLNDSYLEHVPSEDELLIYKALYDDSQGPYTQISYFEPEQYPVFLFSVQPPFAAVRPLPEVGTKYGITSCVFLFFAFSCFGWVMEAVFQLLREGTFTDRGMLLLPWLPIYGFSAMLVLKLCGKMGDRPILIFLANFTVYSVLEYGSNLLFELVHDMKLKDYTGYFLNIDGRTYVGGSLAFALFGCTFYYLLAPAWAEQFKKLDEELQTFITVLLTVLFTADAVLSLFVFSS